MYAGKLVFTQLMDHLPWHRFRRCVGRYHGNRKVKSFSCSDQYRCMAFAQLTYRSSLRDVEVRLRAQSSKLYHMGIRGGVARNALANANAVRDWRIHADFAQHLIHTARQLLSEDSHGLDLANTVYALDSSTIDLCLSLFPWARFRTTKAAVKLHALLDLRGNIPAFIHISYGKLHDVNILDLVVPEPGAFDIMDRAYLDFSRLHTLHLHGAHFVLRAKSNTQLRRLYSRKVDRGSGIICDQIVRPSGVSTAGDYPDKLRRIKYRDRERGKTLVFLTNDFVLPPLTIVLPPLTIADLYRARWQVENPWTYCPPSLGYPAVETVRKSGMRRRVLSPRDRARSHIHRGIGPARPPSAARRDPAPRSAPRQLAEPASNALRRHQLRRW